MVFEETASDGEEEAEPRVRSMEFLCEKKGLCKALDAVLWGFVEAVDVEAELGSIFVLFALDMVVRIEEVAEVFEYLEQGLFGAFLLGELFFGGGLDLEFVAEPSGEVLVGCKESDIQEESVAFFERFAFTVSADLRACVLE